MKIKRNKVIKCNLNNPTKKIEKTRQQEKIKKVIYQIWLKNNKDEQTPNNIINNIEMARTWCKNNGYMHVLIDENSNVYKECINTSKFCKYHLRKNTKHKACILSDYIRLYVLHKFGGIYIDCDVTILHGFDSFLYNDFFICSEPTHHPHNDWFPRLDVGIIGCEKNNSFIEKIIKCLDDVFYRTYFKEVNVSEMLEDKYNIKTNVNKLWVALPDLIPFIIQEMENKCIVKITRIRGPFEKLGMNDEYFEVYDDTFFSRNGFYSRHNFLTTWMRD